MDDNEKNKLQLDLDAPQREDKSGFDKELLPGSRSRFIEIVEDSDEDVGFGSSIKCQSLQWEFQCPLDWSQLKKTEFEDVRYCQRCEENVYTAYSKTEFNRLIKQGACVRVNTQFDKYIMGMMGEVDYPKESELEALLPNAIADLFNAIEYFQKKRGYYPVVKLKRLLARLERFEAQIRQGIRTKTSDTQDRSEAFSLVFSLLKDKVKIQEKLEEAMIYQASEKI